MRAIRSMTVDQDGIQIVRGDGAVWSTTRDQALLMLAGSSAKAVIAAIKESLAAFLDVASADINRQLLLTLKLTGEMSLTLDYSEV